ncbi:MAG TPA: MraY family glycosyltransferase [Chitinophagaceae bacterium]|nr:MraY family glycosyltransferase [Chitinophagaceae bacterium]
MNGLIHLLQINIDFHQFKLPGLSFLSAFIVALVAMPPLIFLVKRYHLYDQPDARKVHLEPVPTLGGIAIWAGMVLAMGLWFPFGRMDAIRLTSLMLCLTALFATGIMDDLHNLPAKYKLIIQIAVATLMSLAGLRITSFNGLFGIQDLPLSGQFTITIITIVGITNAFNLVDGIDGLAGGLGFMSLVTLGLFLQLSGDPVMGLLAFTLAGSLLGFLYYNFNPARIFMGDTGSLVLGFVIAVLCIRLMQVNTGVAHPLLPHAALFSLGIVLIPVFDTLRVFAVRISKGRSPFSPDKNHLHHLVTQSGFSHSFTARYLCTIHGFILLEVYWLKVLNQVLLLALLVLLMSTVTYLAGHMGQFRRKQVQGPGNLNDYELN